MRGGYLSRACAAGAELRSRRAEAARNVEDEVEDEAGDDDERGAKGAISSTERDADGRARTASWRDDTPVSSLINRFTKKEIETRNKLFSYYINYLVGS